MTFRNLESLESVHFLDSQEVCLHFIWVHYEDLILYFCEVSKSLEFITFEGFSGEGVFGPVSNLVMR